MRCCEGALRAEAGRRKARAALALAALALAALALAALLASCQPLPHPFADDRPPADLLAVPESAGVSVAPLEGQPRAIAAPLGAATAHALLGHDIPASDRTLGRGSYQLYGRLTQSQHDGKSAVAVRWRLQDAKGREIGERGVGIEGTAEDWRSAGTAMIEKLAAQSAAAVAPLLVKQPATAKLAAAEPSTARAEPDAPPPEPSPPKSSLPEMATGKPAAETPAAGTLAVPAIPATRSAAASAKPPGGAAASAPATPAATRERGRTRVVVRRVTGAPGDGGTSLLRAVAGVLRQQDLTIVDPGDKADFMIDGEVSLVPTGPDTQHVKIVWHVRNASGAELGNVGQENDVPRGQLSGAWGEVAYVVALAAGDGIMQVLARAAPPANPAAPTIAATSPEPSKTGPGQYSGQPPGGRASAPAAPAAKATNAKGKS